MRTRRYEIKCGEGVVWTLVFEPSRPEWFVEKQGARVVERLTISEFEDSPYGRLCGDQLENALHDASNDL